VGWGEALCQLRGGQIIYLVERFGSLGVEWGEVEDWTQQVFVKKLVCGGATRIWLDRWVGEKPLCEIFRHLYKISNDPDHLIRDMGTSENDWLWITFYKHYDFAT
jgi:hypothetical protein